MRLVIDSSGILQTYRGQPCRVWTGTADETPVVALIACLAVPTSHQPDSALEGLLPQHPSAEDAAAMERSAAQLMDAGRLPGASAARDTVDVSVAIDSRLGIANPPGTEDRVAAVMDALIALLVAEPRQMRGAIAFSISASLFGRLVTSAPHGTGQMMIDAINAAARSTVAAMELHDAPAATETMQ